MPHLRFGAEEVEKCAEEIYNNRLRAQVETEENKGKIIVIDIETGDYEIDDTMLAASERALKKHPDVALWAWRIGYDVVYTFGGPMEPVKR